MKAARPRRIHARLDRIAGQLPKPLAHQVVRDHCESDEAFRRRRQVVTGVGLAGASLLGVSLSSPPGSTRFYLLTLGVAGTWLTGALRSGPVHLGWIETRDETISRPVVVPVLTGVAAFGVFYAGAHVVRRIPVLNDAVARIMQFADRGSSPLVLLTTCANGMAEEVFFRGALYSAVGANSPVLKSTAAYTAATLATRNPALVLASSVMGTVFGLQRRASGGIQAPALTHLTWSVLMLRYLPPLFRQRAERRSRANP
ncbi:CPBP family intramembrane metalloprotease [Nocardioidaceae bacterium SCSIO 66511]|nr:CPBP family intramembrane metalloprotease [Nocardioidaceae bacterium SCSIO 66511]